MALLRYGSEIVSAIDFSGAVGTTRRVVIDPFPEHVIEIRLYARAWGHWLGDDPDNVDNGFFKKLISDGNDLIDGLLPWTGSAKDREAMRQRLSGPSMRKALLLAWKNDISLSVPNNTDEAFENYSLGPLDYSSSDVPLAGSQFNFVACHWNQWASEDGFEVIVELKTDQ